MDKVFGNINFLMMGMLGEIVKQSSGISRFSVPVCGEGTVRVTYNK